MSPALQADSLPAELPGEPYICSISGQSWKMKNQQYIYIYFTDVVSSHRDYTPSGNLYFNFDHSLSLTDQESKSKIRTSKQK